MFIPNLISTDSGGVVSLPSRIAIVEDEPDLREAVAEYLAVNGYEVTAVGSAAAMRALVENETFHLAILDIAMPGEDGLSLGRWLRSQMPIGIIYATAAGTTIDRIVGQAQPNCLFPGDHPVLTRGKPQAPLLRAAHRHPPPSKQEKHGGLTRHEPQRSSSSRALSSLSSPARTVT